MLKPLNHLLTDGPARLAQSIGSPVFGNQNGPAETDNKLAFFMNHPGFFRNRVRGPVNDNRYDLNPEFLSNLKSPRFEFADLAIWAPCSLREKKDADPLSQPLTRLVNSLFTALSARPLERDVAGKPHVPAQKRQGKKFLFRDKFEMVRDAAKRHQDIEKTLVVGNKNVRLRRIDQRSALDPELPERTEEKNIFCPEDRNLMEHFAGTVAGHQSKRKKKNESERIKQRAETNQHQPKQGG